jgi:hypothetical protein
MEIPDIYLLILAYFIMTAMMSVWGMIGWMVGWNWFRNYRTPWRWTLAIATGLAFAGLCYFTYFFPDYARSLRGH